MHVGWLASLVLPAHLAVQSAVSRAGPSCLSVPSFSELSVCYPRVTPYNIAYVTALKKMFKNNLVVTEQF